MKQRESSHNYFYFKTLLFIKEGRLDDVKSQILKYQELVSKEQLLISFNVKNFLYKDEMEVVELEFYKIENSNNEAANRNHVRNISLNLFPDCEFIGLLAKDKINLVYDIDAIPEYLNDFFGIKKP